MGNKPWRYAVVLDAGSSGTRAHVYRWLHPTYAREHADAPALHSLPEIHTKHKWTKKTKPGLSSFAASPEELGPNHLQQLLEHVLKVVPDEAVPETPIFLLATAGMRLLPEAQRTALLDSTCTYIRTHSRFQLPECARSVQVIDGATEGLYGWLATNYLVGSFDDTIKPPHTYGFLDMGGASAQIAFEPNATEAERHANDLTLLRLRTVEGKSLEHKLFTTSWLGYGVHQARDRYLQSLLKETSSGSGVRELRDPCLPSGFQGRSKANISSSPSKEVEVELLGTGNFDECLRQTYPLLEKNAPCPDEPCLVHGVHVPAIDFDVNHFIGVSEWWHTTHQVFQISQHEHANDANNKQEDAEKYDFNTYQERVKSFCGTGWDQIKQGVEEHRFGRKVDYEDAAEICFKASWLVNLLHEGIGVPRLGLDEGSVAATKGGNVSSETHGEGSEDAFRALDKIGSTEISWTLGKAVLVASSEVPPQEGKAALPVGFGSNVASSAIPADFQYPGASSLSKNSTLGPGTAPPTAEPAQPTQPESPHWHDRLFDVDSPRRVPGFILFLFIILIALFLACGRDRRQRIFRKFFSPRSGRYSRLSGGNGGVGSMIASKIPFLRSSGSSSAYADYGYDYDRALEEGVREFELEDVDSDTEVPPSFRDLHYTQQYDPSSPHRPSSRTRTRPSSTHPTSLPSSPPQHHSHNQPSQQPRDSTSTTSSARTSIQRFNSHPYPHHPDLDLDLDRQGVALKTESRDGLPSPSLGVGIESTHSGRKSRAASPSRTRRAAQVSTASAAGSRTGSPRHSGSPVR